MKKIDLHMHSRYSDDGEFSPTELVRQCVEAGIGMMAVADHNTVRGCMEAIKAAKEAGICCIPAIEIDCVWNGMNFHVLGYGIDSLSEDFIQIENNIRTQREQASQKMLQKTRELGFEVSEEEMEQLSAGSYWEKCWTGEMFAEVLLSKEAYQEHPLLAPYRSGGERSDNPYVNFYWDYYSQGKPCYVEVHFPEMKQVIDIIHKNGGDAVLAHPGVNLKGKENLLEKIAALGIDGVEGYSSYHTKEQSIGFCKEAKRLGLAITCGSDYHGKTKPSVHLAKTGADEKEMKRIWEKVFDTHGKV